MSVEAGTPKHKRQNQEIGFAKNEKEVEDSGVASSICMSARNRTSTADEVRYKGGGSNPPPAPPTVSRDEPPNIVSSRSPFLASKSYHITAVLKRNSRYDELMGRPSKIERTQCSSSGASSANPVEGRGSPQTPPDTEVAYCTNPNCTDSKCLNCHANVSKLPSALGLSMVSTKLNKAGKGHTVQSRLLMVTPI